MKIAKRMTDLISDGISCERILLAIRKIESGVRILVKPANHNARKPAAYND